MCRGVGDRRRCRHCFVHGVCARGRRQGRVSRKLRQGCAVATVDRADNKQYRELYASPEAIAAAKKGEPLPSGTVLTLVQYAAKLDEKGNPVKAPTDVLSRTGCSPIP